MLGSKSAEIMLKGCIPMPNIFCDLGNPKLAALLQVILPQGAHWCPKYVAISIVISRVLEYFHWKIEDDLEYLKITRVLLMFVYTCFRPSAGSFVFEVCSVFHMRRGWKSCDHSALRRKGSGRISAMCIYLLDGKERGNQTSR